MEARPSLQKFSIETDQLVLVTFADGTERRLARRELKRQLVKADYDRVMAAYRLRQNFWRRNLPKGLAAVAVGACASALVVAGSQPLSHLVPGKQALNGHPAAELSAQAIPTPTPSPKPAGSLATNPVTPAAAPSATPAQATHKRGAWHAVTGLINRVLQ